MAPRCFSSSTISRTRSTECLSPARKIREYSSRRSFVDLSTIRGQVRIVFFALASEIYFAVGAAPYRFPVMSLPNILNRVARLGVSSERGG
jgi:hypothetical protein